MIHGIPSGNVYLKVSMIPWNMIDHMGMYNICSTLITILDTILYYILYFLYYTILYYTILYYTILPNGTYGSLAYYDTMIHDTSYGNVYSKLIMIPW